MEHLNFYRETGLFATQHPEAYRNWIIDRVNYRLKISLLDFQNTLEDCISAFGKVSAQSAEPKHSTRIIELAA